MTVVIGVLVLVLSACAGWQGARGRFQNLRFGVGRKDGSILEEGYHALAKIMESKGTGERG